MARLAQETALPEDVAASRSDEAELVNLTRLLISLQRNILHPTLEQERRLRVSELERTKVERILEYARSVLTKLEQDALQVQAPTKRAKIQSLLNENRDRLESLLDRLQDFRHMAVDDDGSSDGDDVLEHVIPTPSESIDSDPPAAQDEGEESKTRAEQVSSCRTGAPLPEQSAVEATPTLEPHGSSQQPAGPIDTTTCPSPATQTTQAVRLRSRQAAQPSSSTPDPVSHSTARAALFANRSNSVGPRTSNATAEAILDQQRAEQDFLSESILKMAGALKESSQKFSTTLDADKDVLEKAGEGISKTEQSMEAARGRMGTLRKMTEGKGWWGRMMLFAWVYGLMFGLILLVFVMPKLRF